MKWMVGIDSRERAGGAVACARWMAGRSADQAFVAGHAVELSVSEFFDGIEPAQRVDAPPYLSELFAPLRELGLFAEFGSINASAAEDGLEAAIADRSCDALIIGRRRPRDSATWIRLGRVARRLLRTLPVPAVVVPPDLAVDDLGDGPILVATDCGPDSSGAARLAATLAQDLDLDVLVTTVAVAPSDIPWFMPDERLRELTEHGVQRSRKHLATWVDAHDLSSARTSVVEGRVTGRLLEVARTAGASMIVVGSRGLSTVDRLFASSVGSELAASAPIPVAVVPADWSPATSHARSAAMQNLHPGFLPAT